MACRDGNRNPLCRDVDGRCKLIQPGIPESQWPDCPGHEPQLPPDPFAGILRDVATILIAGWLAKGWLFAGDGDEDDD